MFVKTHCVLGENAHVRSEARATSANHPKTRYIAQLEKKKSDLKEMESVMRIDDMADAEANVDTHIIYVPKCTMHNIPPMILAQLFSRLDESDRRSSIPHLYILCIHSMEIKMLSI